MAFIGEPEKGQDGLFRPQRSTAGRGLARRVMDMLFPPLCLACATEVDAQGHLCPACWSALNFIEGSHCAGCGRPFETDLGPDMRCAPCLARPPAFAAARAVLRYDDASRPLILALKHGDRHEAVPAFGRWMARAGGALLAAPGLPAHTLVAPVPLHRRRLWRRRYNQAGLLGAAVAARLGLPHMPDLLQRLRATPSQGGLSRKERRRNVRDAFAVRGHHAGDIRDAHVILVDDVMTTGATLDACARAVLAAGAARVSVLVLARAV